MFPEKLRKELIQLPPVEVFPEVLVRKRPPDDLQAALERYRSFYYFSDRDELFEKQIQMEEAYRDGASTFELTKKYLENISTVISIHFAERVLPEQLPLFEEILEKQNPSRRCGMSRGGRGGTVG